MSTTHHSAEGTNRPSNPFTWLIDKISGFGGALAGVAVVACMLAICFEVVMRYAFDRPTIWANEISEYLLTFSVFMAVGYILREDAHVHVDLVVNTFPKKAQEWVAIIVSCLALAYCVVMAWQGWVRSIDSYVNGFASSTLLRFPLWLPQIFMPIGFAMMTLQYIVKISRRIRNLL